MELRISLAPGGDLRLHLPSGRWLDLGGDYALKFVQKMLREAPRYADPGSQPKGYCRGFPTQAVVDAWIKQDTEAKREAAAERAKADAEALGIDLAVLDFRL